MTMPNRATRRHPVEIPELPIPGGADNGSRWLIAAVLAAGKDGCDCDACKLLKKFGGALSEAMLKESEEVGDTDT